KIVGSVVMPTTTGVPLTVVVLPSGVVMVTRGVSEPSASEARSVGLSWIVKRPPVPTVPVKVRAPSATETLEPAAALVTTHEIDWLTSASAAFSSPLPKNASYESVGASRS
ncbi:hypothetical protein ISU79_17165, partial [Leptospira borgpetersenii serovar Ballum]|nr:hypothetical protein [Leptospira borgpetersenii serovar Ballum]